VPKKVDKKLYNRLFSQRERLMLIVGLICEDVALQYVENIIFKTGNRHASGAGSGGLSCISINRE
jgi:hypothetical protein